MGDIRRARKQYQTPSHPWEAARMAEEKPLFKDYGLGNKKELWKRGSMAKAIALQAKKLIAKRDDKQAIKEKELLMQRLIRYNLIRPGDPIESALALSSKDILERRLQTMVVRKNFARSMKQARQLITHKHMMINSKVITSPSYIVSAVEESQIGYSGNSPFVAEDHPERPEANVKKQIAEEKAKIEGNESAK